MSRLLSIIDSNCHDYCQSLTIITLLSTSKNSDENEIRRYSTSIEDPYTYITFDVRTLDQQTHNIRLYFEEGPMLGINNKDEKIYWIYSLHLFRFSDLVISLQDCQFFVQ